MSYDIFKSRKTRVKGFCSFRTLLMTKFDLVFVRFKISLKSKPFSKAATNIFLFFWTQMLALSSRQHG